MTSIATVILAIRFAAPVVALPRDQEPAALRAADDPLADAKALMTQDNWPAAATAFLKHLRKQSETAHATEARFWVGYCFVKAGDFELAIEYLKPFESGGAGGLEHDKWADDALLQLGHAYRGADERDLAVGAWKRLVDDYADSPWKNEALLNIVQLLYYDAADFAACVPHCERIMNEIADPNTTWEIRYIGAYCLNATRRFDDAAAWIEKWFAPDNSSQEAWRVLLGAQRDLLSGDETEAVAAIESLRHDFADLDGNEWLDLLVRTSAMVRQSGHAGLARTLLVDALPSLQGFSTDSVSTILNELAVVIGTEKRQEFIDAIAPIADARDVAATVRLAVRERQVSELRALERSAEAAAVLRDALGNELPEFCRARLAMLLGDVLASDLEKPDDAIKLLEEALPSMKRRDLVNGVRQKLNEIRAAAKSQ